MIDVSKLDVEVMNENELQYLIVGAATSTFGTVDFARGSLEWKIGAACECTV